MKRKTLGRCKYCGGMQGQWVRTIATNGAQHFWVRCMTCQKNFNGKAKYLSKKEREEYGVPNNALIVNDYRGSVPCSVKGCTNTAVEYHHFMPIHLADDEDDANKWPIEPLCRKHHREWHEKVTPYMNGTRRHVVINFCPICQKRVSRASVQNISNPLPRWRVHCRDGAWCHITSERDGLDYVVYMEGAAYPKEAA